MQRSAKQDELFSAYKSGKYDEYILAGGANSTKTYGILMLLNSICMLCPGIRGKAFRLSDRNIRENLIPSFQKVLKDLQLSIPIVNLTAHYKNGSELLFGWADITKDRDCDNVKGGEYAFIYFNEANQIDKRYIEVARTRLGRWSDFTVDDKNYYVKPSLFMDFNPTNNWVKKEYKDPASSGSLPAHVFYQESTPYDNPWIKPETLKILENLPENERQRYLFCNWDYGDDPDLLVPYEFVKNNLIENSTEGMKYLGVDVARYGDDDTVFVYIEGDCFFDTLELTHQDTAETGNRTMFEAQAKGIGFQNIGIDVVGLGAGAVDTCWSKNFRVLAFNGADEPQTRSDFYLFKNKRTEAYWLLREDLINGRLKILNCEKTKKAIEQLTQIKYIIKEKLIMIEPKDDIKKRIGESPDHADALAIANFMRHQKHGSIVSATKKDLNEANLMTRSF